jgi:hypothetical protein
MWLSPVPPDDWYPLDTFPKLPPAPAGLELDFSATDGLSRPLWKSLASNFRDKFSPQYQPPLMLTSRPVNVGMLVSDRMSAPWYRTIFTNIGDVVSPDTQPPLELESRPVDVGELLGDQISHWWMSSLIRNLADTVAPEKLPPLEVTSTPDASVLPSKVMAFPRWSSLIEVAQVTPTEKPAPVIAPVRSNAVPPAPPTAPVVARLEYLHQLEYDLRRDLGRSRLRARVWMALASAQVIVLIAGLILHW